MPSKKTNSGIVAESLKAIPFVETKKSLRTGLAGMMTAVLDGELAVEDATVLLKATKKQSKKISKSAA